MTRLSFPCHPREIFFWYALRIPFNVNFQTKSHCEAKSNRGSQEPNIQPSRLHAYRNSRFYRDHWRARRFIATGRTASARSCAAHAVPEQSQATRHCDAELSQQLSQISSWLYFECRSIWPRNWKWVGLGKFNLAAIRTVPTALSNKLQLRHRTSIERQRSTSKNTDVFVSIRCNSDAVENRETRPVNWSISNKYL